MTMPDREPAPSDAAESPSGPDPWPDAAILGGPPGFWQSDDPVDEAQARQLLHQAVGLPAGALAAMTAAEVVATMGALREKVRRLMAARATDELTGAMVRGAGLAALQREVDRVSRTSRRLVVAFIDVDGLKAVNDREGHLAGDRLLREVVAALRAQLRSYDLVIRYAGDEFVCVLPDTDLADVRSRFVEVEAMLAARSPGRSASVGMTELADGDSVDDLIGRADADMYGSRGRRPGGHSPDGIPPAPA